MTKLFGIVVAILTVGCGRASVDAICEHLEQCEGGVGADCQEDGEEVEQLSESRGCEAELDAYIDCIEATGCDYADVCEPEVRSLRACGVELPPAG